MFKPRADAGQVHPGHVRHPRHAVGVAHRHAGHRPGPAAHHQLLANGRPAAKAQRGQVGGGKAGPAHLHLPHAVAAAPQRFDAREGLHFRLILHKAVLKQPLGNASDAVAAHGPLAAVGVEHAHLCVRRVAVADADEAVRPHGKVPGAQGHRRGSRVKGKAGKAVHIDVVVAAALHFGEIQNHRKLPPPGRKRAHFARRPRFDFIIASNPGQHKENRQKTCPRPLTTPHR